MEIHAPHSPIHSWRDFFIHLATIAVGLMIALAFEAAAESLHHRHLVAEARANLHREIAANHKLYSENAVQLQAARELMERNVDQLRDLRAGRAPQQPDLHWNVAFDDYDNAAWETARESGAVPFMGLDTIEAYSGLYSQHAFVNDAGARILLDLTKAGAPMLIARDHKDPKEFAPADVQAMLTAAAELEARLQTLQKIMKGLDDDYVEALKQ